MVIFVLTPNDGLTHRCKATADGDVMFFPLLSLLSVSADLFGSLAVILPSNTFFIVSSKFTTPQKKRPGFCASGLSVRLYSYRLRLFIDGRAGGAPSY